MKNQRPNRWALFTTNYGRTAINTLQLFREGKLGDIEIGFVLYENLPSGAAELAEEINIKTIRLQKKEFASRRTYEEHLVKILDEYKIDFIFLLGFSYFLQHDLINKYEGRLINIHPSLLPSFPGKRAIQQAMDYGVKISGITTHYIDIELDKGEIISQIPIEINDHDSFKDIDDKFLKNVPSLLVKTIKNVEKKFSKFQAS